MSWVTVNVTRKTWAEIQEAIDWSVAQNFCHERGETIDHVGGITVPFYFWRPNQGLLFKLAWGGE